MPRCSNKVLRDAANATMAHLGVGHSEASYQCLLVQLLGEQGVSARTEVHIPYMHRGVCVGLGRADILLQSHIIELKITRPQDGIQQLRRYMQAMRDTGAAPRAGMLVYFNQASGRAEVTFVPRLPLK